jgi:hypothetical protein
MMQHLCLTAAELRVKEILQREKKVRLLGMANTPRNFTMSSTPLNFTTLKGVFKRI